MRNLILILASCVAAFGVECSERSNRLTEPSVPDSMNIMDKEPAPDDPVVWGGRGVEVTVHKGWVTIELGGGTAVIESGLKTDKNGRFSQKGSFTPARPGPVRVDEPAPQSFDVRIEGRITDNKMFLKLKRASDGSLIGEYSLQKGKGGRIIRML